MFNNVGRTIKILAKVFLGVGIGLSVLVWMVCLFKGTSESNELLSDGLMFIGIATLILGPLVSWINSILLYGFGSLIENSEDVKNMMYDGRDEAWYNYDVDRYGYNDAAENSAPPRGIVTDDSLEEAICFLNQKYGTHIELSDDLYTIKEKVLKINSVNNSAQIFKTRISDARSLDDAVSIIKMHCTINR